MLLCLSLMMSAVDKRLDDINAVKKNRDYLYGEATMVTQEEAAQLAFDQLREAMVQWTAEAWEEPMDSLTAQGILLQADTMMMRRANMFRVFAYIKKTDIVSDHQPASSAPVLINDTVKQKLIRYFSVGKDYKVLQKMMKARNFFDLKDIMLPLKESGEITDYGKYATAENPTECYLVVYDPAGNIRAWLDKGEDVRRNLKTGKADSVHNYRGCGAIWFKIL